MDLKTRKLARAQAFVRYSRFRLVPTASLRREILAGKWSERGAADRLEHLARAVLATLCQDGLFAGSYRGHMGLFLGKSPCLRIGIQGGKHWLLMENKEQLAGLADRLRGPGDTGSLADALPQKSKPHLELLDLSTLGISDWKGVVASPAVARLVLLAETLRPEPDSSKPEQVFPLVLDFDVRLADAGRASGFIDLIADQLRSLETRK